MSPALKMYALESGLELTGKANNSTGLKNLCMISFGVFAIIRGTRKNISRIVSKNVAQKFEGRTWVSDLFP